MGWDRHKLLWDGTGQLNMSHGQPCIYTKWRSKLHHLRQNYTTMRTYGEISEIQIGCYKGDPGQQHHSGQWYCFYGHSAGSSHDLHWLNKTVRSLSHWNFHLLSFWLALLLLCDVGYVTINEKFAW